MLPDGVDTLALRDILIGRIDAARRAAGEWSAGKEEVKRLRRSLHVEENDNVPTDNQKPPPLLLLPLLQPLLLLPLLLQPPLLPLLLQPPLLPLPLLLLLQPLLLPLLLQPPLLLLLQPLLLLLPPLLLLQRLPLLLLLLLLLRG
ncbi:unnamed protein product [Lampetra planeri]